MLIINNLSSFDATKKLMTSLDHINSIYRIHALLVHTLINCCKCMYTGVYLLLLQMCGYKVSAQNSSILGEKAYESNRLFTVSYLVN